jgi:hypothetical protein
VVSELLGWPQDITLRLDPKVFESKLFSKKILLASLHFKNVSPFLLSEVKWMFAAKRAFARMKMVSPSC